MPKSVYALSKRGILQYYNDALNAVNKLSLQKKSELSKCKNAVLKKKLQKEFNEKYNFTLKKEPLTNITHYFNELPEEIKKIAHDNNDYQIILHDLTDIELKGQLWHFRLRYICVVLLDVFKEIGKRCEQINLGIFGSESLTSDIDIGVFYKENITINKNTIKLSEIVKSFESIFVKQKYTSLDLDTEMYANYSVKNVKPFIKTDDAGYDKMIPYVVAGMIKNYFQSLFDSNNSLCDIRRKIKLLHKKNCDRDKIIKKIDYITPSNIIDIPNKSLLSREDINFIKEEITKCFEDSKEIISEYINHNYKSGCKKYYDTLDKIHDEYIKKDINISELNKYISYALVFRAESYQCSPTIYHVVYGIQASSNKNEKKKIHNLVNNSGYILSMMEQIGYLSRFYNEYKKTKNKQFFYKKKKKYEKRLIDAIYNKSLFDKQTNNKKTNKKFTSSTIKKRINIDLKKQKKSKKLYEKCIKKCDSIATLPQIENIELKKFLQATKKCKKVKSKKKGVSHKKYFKCIQQKQKQLLNKTKKYKHWNTCQKKKCSKEYDNYINMFN